jgi:putative endonuclease
MASSRLPGPITRAWLALESRTLRGLFRRSRRVRTLPSHLATGMSGELEAIFYLRRLGYIIVARRWRSARLPGDLDLIAWDGPTLCFLEIKTRTGSHPVPGEAAVDHDKQRTLQRLARSYLNRLPAARREAPARFDVLSIHLQSPQPDFTLYKDAFSWK